MFGNGGECLGMVRNGEEGLGIVGKCGHSSELFAVFGNAVKCKNENLSLFGYFKYVF